MTRYIPIDNCEQCPFKDHKGAFAEVSYVPVCRKTNCILPHSIEKSGNQTVARHSNEIPDWCPLSKL
jgi:hypothetical protein